MLLFVLPVCLGAVIGLGRGGRLHRVSELRLRQPVLLLLGLTVQASLVHIERSWRLPLVFATYAVTGGWVVLNMAGRPLPVRGALGLVGLGWALNLAVMAPNGGMPVSADALLRLGVASGYDVTEGHLSKHVISDATTPLRWLGDTIAVPPLQAVISLGDVVLAVGIAALVIAAMGTGRSISSWRRPAPATGRPGSAPPPGSAGACSPG